MTYIQTPETFAAKECRFVLWVSLLFPAWISRHETRHLAYVPGIAAKSGLARPEMMPNSLYLPWLSGNRRREPWRRVRSRLDPPPLHFLANPSPQFEGRRMRDVPRVLRPSARRSVASETARHSRNHRNGPRVSRGDFSCPHFAVGNGDARPRPRRQSRGAFAAQPKQAVDARDGGAGLPYM
jgi:hypothetical protein